MNLQALERDSREVANSLSDKLAEMALASGALAIALYREIVDTLEQFRSRVLQWSDGLISLQNVDEDPRVDSLVVEHRSTFVAEMLAALQGIRILANRLLHGQAAREVLGVDAESARTKSSDELSRLKSRAKDRLKDGLVRVLGKNSRHYHYSLDYYAALSAHSAASKLKNRETLLRVSTAGGDLVQVSPQPSTIGDFCDVYRGKVFSISGKDPFFHPLKLIPNGGCPMHPWCHHTLLAFDPSGMTNVQLAERQYVPKEFLELGRLGAGANEFQAAWKARKAKTL